MLRNAFHITTTQPTSSNNISETQDKMAIQKDQVLLMKPCTKLNSALGLLAWMGARGEGIFQTRNHVPYFGVIVEQSAYIQSIIQHLPPHLPRYLSISHVTTRVTPPPSCTFPGFEERAMPNRTAGINQASI